MDSSRGPRVALLAQLFKLPKYGFIPPSRVPLLNSLAVEGFPIGETWSGDFLYDAVSWAEIKWRSVARRNVLRGVLVIIELPNIVVQFREITPAISITTNSFPYG